MIGREIYITGLRTNALFQEQIDNQSFMGGSRGEFYLYDADSYSPATILQNIDNVRSDCSEGVCVKIIDKSQFGSIIDENPEKAKTHGNLVEILGIVDVTEHGIVVKCHDGTTSAYDLY